MSRGSNTPHGGRYAAKTGYLGGGCTVQIEDNPPQGRRSGGGTHALGELVESGKRLGIQRDVDAAHPDGGAAALAVSLACISRHLPRGTPLCADHRASVDRARDISLLRESGATTGGAILPPLVRRSAARWTQCRSVERRPAAKLPFRGATCGTGYSVDGFALSVFTRHRLPSSRTPSPKEEDCREFLSLRHRA